MWTDDPPPLTQWIWTTNNVLLAAIWPTWSCQVGTQVAVYRQPAVLLPSRGCECAAITLLLAIHMLRRHMHSNISRYTSLSSWPDRRVLKGMLMGKEEVEEDSRWWMAAWPEACLSTTLVRISCCCRRTTAIVKWSPGRKDWTPCPWQTTKKIKQKIRKFSVLGSFQFSSAVIHRKSASFKRHGPV